MPVFDRVIPPGGEGKITLKVHTRGRPGTFRKSARVYTNDPFKKIQLITVRATVRVPVALSTTYLYFAGLSDSPITKTVAIESKDESNIRVEALSFNLDSRLSYRIEEVNPGRKFRVHVTTIPGTSGTYLGALKLKTNHPKKPTVTIRIRGRIKKSPSRQKTIPEKT